MQIRLSVTLSNPTGTVRVRARAAARGSFERLTFRVRRCSRRWRRDRLVRSTRRLAKGSIADAPRMHALGDRKTVVGKGEFPHVTRSSFPNRR